MFIFHRNARNGNTDVFDICLPEDAIEDAESRFGPALNFFVPRSEDRYHHLGWVVLIDHEDKKETEFFLSCKNLSESESTTLWNELTMVVGKNVFTGGAWEPIFGWFANDSLR